MGMGSGFVSILPPFERSFGNVGVGWEVWRPQSSLGNWLQPGIEITSVSSMSGSYRFP